jgi:hypothetical protein
MPARLKRPCAFAGGCPALVDSGYCAEHQPKSARASASQRGYGVAWRRFVVWMRKRMLKLGIVPVCGASLPGGPDLSLVSRCRQAKVLTAKGLHLHHEPALRPEERTSERAVCDPARVGFLCVTCHNAIKDEGERGGVAA